MHELRIGIYTEVYRPIRNGVVASVDALASGLDARGIDVTCTAPSMPGAPDDRAFVRRIPSFPLPTKTGYRLVLPFARADRSRTVVHAHSPFVTGAMALRLANRCRAPLVFTYHTRLSAYAHYAPIDARIARPFLDALTRTYANSASAVVVPTAAMRDELRAIGVGSRIEVVATGVDAARYARAARDPAVRSRLGAADDAPLVLWAGRIAHEKNLPLALAAFARLPDERSRLAVVGDGVSRTRAVRTVRELGIAGRVRFAGETAPERMAEIYAAADALLFTSTTETQGLVLTEARAAGLPIVAVDGAVTRAVAGPAARFAAADAEALATALGSVLAARRVRVSPDERSAELAALGHEAALDAMLSLYHSFFE